MIVNIAENINSFMGLKKNVPLFIQNYNLQTYQLQLHKHN